MSEASSRKGVEKAAILLMTLGESEAAEILKHLGAKDVQKLGRTMADLAGVSREEVRNVLVDFNSAVEIGTSVGVGGDGEAQLLEDARYVLLDAALGQEDARRDRRVRESFRHQLQHFPLASA